MLIKTTNSVTERLYTTITHYHNHIFTLFLPTNRFYIYFIKLYDKFNCIKVYKTRVKSVRAYTPSLGTQHMQIPLCLCMSVITIELRSTNILY